MKKIILYLLMIILFSCEKKDEEIVKNEFKRKSFLIVNDTTDCNYINYDSKILQQEKDSIDLNFDNKNDLEFISEEEYIDNCDETNANCPPDAICDCWPYWATKFYINLPSNIEILVNSYNNVLSLNLDDTISNECIWLNRDKILIYQCNMQMGGEYSYPANINLGLRTIKNEDTIYSYIKILFEENKLKINSIVTQK